MCRMFGSLKKQLSYCGEPSPKQNRTLPSSNLSCRKLSDLESPNVCFLTTLRTRQYGSFPYDTKDRFANLKNEKGKHGTENVSIIPGRRNSYMCMPGTNKRARFY